MATSSRFFRIDDFFLLEYIYSDGNDPLDVSDSGFNLLKNQYYNENLLFSSDGAKNTLRNVRDYSSVEIDRNLNKWAYLNVDVGQTYNDFDSKLTDDDDLPLSFDLDYPIRYDKVRLHIASGYQFDDNDGFILELRVLDRAKREHSLASITYRRSDEWAIINPNEFLLGETLWNVYVEFQVPSLYYMLLDQNVNFEGDPSYLSKQLTGGIGISNGSQITAYFHRIQRSETDPLRDHTFFITTPPDEFSIPRQDEYSLLSADIEESNDGDFFELSARFDGENIENYIGVLNQQPNSDYIIIHDIAVFENLSGSEVQPTYPQRLIQDENFEQSIVFRPVILNSNIATSWRLVYSIMLMNRATNESVVKTSQRIFTDVRKYGRTLNKLNLGTSPKIDKIYNFVQNMEYKVVSPQSQNLIQSTSKFVPVFFDRENILATQNVASVSANNEVIADYSVRNITGDASTSAKEQGELVLNLTPIDNFYLFRLYRGQDDGLVPLDLKRVGTITLIFLDDAGEKIRVESQIFGDVDPSNGEVLFRIDGSLSTKLLNQEDKNWYLTVRNSTGDETQIFSGTYLDRGVFNLNRTEVLINRLTQQKRNLDFLVENGRQAIRNQAREVIETRNELNRLKFEKQKLQSDVSRLVQRIDTLNRRAAGLTANTVNPNIGRLRSGLESEFTAVNTLSSSSQQQIVERSVGGSSGGAL